MYLQAEQRVGERNQAMASKSRPSRRPVAQHVTMADQVLHEGLPLSRAARTSSRGASTWRVRLLPLAEVAGEEEPAADGRGYRVPGGQAPPAALVSPITLFICQVSSELVIAYIVAFVDTATRCFNAALTC
ncbi:uncharacterized protein LOC119335137 [Triticum dicoccoides]|uniref:uncharacterized protein LOC119335137 n=1 Tax=Triticum dicoccoides TaxID=85692 RepID=UPI00188EAB1C|nr:uncharacterized protein LOC119335137 [Triticum dicoccoides]